MLLHKSYAKQCTYVLFVSLVYFFIFLPMIGIFFHSFNTSSIASTWTGLTLDWYKALFKSPEIGKAAWHSLVIAIGSTTLSVILGTAFVLGTAEKKYSKLDALFYPNIFTPDIVLAVAIMSLFKFFSIPCGFVSLIAGHTAIGLVFTIPLLRSRMEELDKFLIEASLDLGADHWYTTKKVLLPLLKPAIVTAAFIAFTLSLDDFFISFFCAGNEIETLSMYIFSHLRTNNTPVLSALSICIVTISFTFLMVGYAITKYTTMERKNDTA